MKAKIYDSKGKEKNTIDLPNCFLVKPRDDIVLKVFEVQKMAEMQSWGSKPGAGAQYSASGILRHKRHAWKTTYGKGISRVPRKIMSRSGASFNWVGATVSSARGGRSPHAPKSEKNLFKKINKKELVLAFYSALSGTFNELSLEKKYGSKIPSGFVFEGSFLKLKSKGFFEILKLMYGPYFDKVIQRKKVRAGKGKLRGRKYKSNAGLLFVIGKDESMKRKGIDVVNADKLRISDLAPNGHSGRLTCYSEMAIKELGEMLK